VDFAAGSDYLGSEQRVVTNQFQNYCTRKVTTSAAKAGVSQRLDRRPEGLRHPKSGADGSENTL